MESSNLYSKVRELQLMQRLVKQRHSHCMTWFEQLEIHLRDLYLNSSSHAVDAFKPAFHSFFSEEHQTFRLKMFHNLDQHELPCASRKFQGIRCAMIGGEGDGVSNWTSRVGLFWERVNVISINAFLSLSGGETLKSIEDEEISFVDGVLEGALGALGDKIRSLGDGVFVSSWVKSTNNCFGGMMLIFGLLETLEVEALVEPRIVGLLMMSKGMVNFVMHLREIWEKICLKWNENLDRV
ncbi:hypothetical protein Tco_1030805 [Tanacetum coccineum]|uniref:Uncharacterized protein n=1 Tax=Tanacetum coccineum TaxID=301880 RepID=A0ABQ5G7Y6_9ASTR